MHHLFRGVMLLVFGMVEKGYTMIIAIQGICHSLVDPIICIHFMTGHPFCIITLASGKTLLPRLQALTLTTAYTHSRVKCGNGKTRMRVLAPSISHGVIRSVPPCQAGHLITLLRLQTLPCRICQSTFDQAPIRREIKRKCSVSLYRLLQRLLPPHHLE